MANEFLKELNIEGVAEVIAERFDSAIDFMHSDAIVYGGAIRDVLAKMPLEGDLDIATDAFSHKHTVRNFRGSTKWTEQGRKWQSALRPSRRTASTMPDLLREEPSSPYRGGDMPVADIISFITFDKAKTQIVMAKGQTKDSFDAALEIVKHVDFVCCGLMMDNTGRVFEIIEGAYEDCKNRILRLNKAVKNININNLRERVAKLKKRGWESKVNISAIKRKMEKANKARVANQERLAKSQNRHMAKSSQYEKSTKICRFITIKASRTGPFDNYSIHFSRKEYTRNYAEKSKHRNFAGLAQTLTAISNVASKIKMKIAHKPGSGGDIIIHILENKITRKRAGHFAKELQYEFERLASSHDDGHDGPYTKKTTSARAYGGRSSSADNPVYSGSIKARVANQERLVKSQNSPNDEDTETMLFKATMSPDGQIMINPAEIGPDTPAGGVTIDVDSLSPEAAQRLKDALEDMSSELLNPTDVVSLAEMSLEEQDSIDVRVMGKERPEDADDISSLLEIGEDSDERDRR